jgi:hypothetical protein
MQKEKGNKEIVNCPMKPFIAAHKLQAADLLNMTL